MPSEREVKSFSRILVTQNWLRFTWWPVEVKDKLRLNSDVISKYILTLSHNFFVSS